MKKLFLKSLVFCTFAFSMLSCNETMDMYGENGQGRGLVQRKNPIDYEQFALDLDSLGALYERDVIVYGVPDIEYQSIIRLTESAMRRIGEREVGSTFVLITIDGIERDSIPSIRGAISGNYENITPGSHVFEKSIYPILPENTTISWSNQGADVSMPPYTIISQNITIDASQENVSLSGRFSIHYDTDDILFPIYIPGITPNPSNIIAYGFSGVSNEEDTWEIHPYAGPNP